jgi:hypothetical protein
MLRAMRHRQMAAAALIAVASVFSGTEFRAQAPTVPRTFPQFVGSWVLDETASTGQLNIAPRIPLRLTIETSPTSITVTKRLRLGATDRVSDTPPAEVYRFDGVETSDKDSRTGAILDRTYRFTLAADMLVLTIKEGPRTDGSFTLVTDAYAVDGDVLTLYRQLVSVRPGGLIATMGVPANNFRHTFIYRRSN